MEKGDKIFKKDQTYFQTEEQIVSITAIKIDES